MIFVSPPNVFLPQRRATARRRPAPPGRSSSGANVLPNAARVPMSEKNPGDTKPTPTRCGPSGRWSASPSPRIQATPLSADAGARPVLERRVRDEARGCLPCRAGTA